MSHSKLCWSSSSRMVKGVGTPKREPVSKKMRNGWAQRKNRWIFSRFRVLLPFTNPHSENWLDSVDISEILAYQLSNCHKTRGPGGNRAISEAQSESAPPNLPSCSQVMQSPLETADQHHSKADYCSRPATGRGMAIGCRVSGLHMFHSCS
ncbi:hypothetical protein BAQU_1458 [Bifidobacterium aquikefiri]|uniref:Uncharacterized protein n=1 Tax=Bifidobacterium aquikefiri TaxID=1653207 RepID=A0A261G3Y2_9BIFI|nr:hypothetical protein BAQU_1458 [Bifidobacterium aquikefiri]